MKFVPETFFIFTTFFFLSILFAAVFSLSRYLRKRDVEDVNNKINSFMGAFQVLGDEVKSLKNQLDINERLAALGEVSAGIAHELRNPMGIIGGYAKLLLKEFEASDPRREMVMAIIDEIGEMNKVMEELLRFTRLEELNKTDMDVSYLVREAIDSIVSNGYNIEVFCDSGIFIKGDIALLRRALKNLIANAMDAGTTVQVSVERGFLSNKAGVFIRVSDNGDGIPDKDMNKIFMPFYTTKNGGMGIGLALVHKIITSHGGSVTANSVKGKGSVFNIFLPGQ
jgi:signal transduction histidine kinase